MNLLLVNGRVVSDKVIRDGAVAIEGNRIVEVGSTGELKARYPGHERIDARDHLVIPGLINTHTHAAMTLMRGYADDLNLQGFLERCWPLESRISGPEIEIGAELAAAESLLAGVTTINTQYHYFPDHNEAEGLSRVGARGVVGHACFSWRREHDVRMVEDSVERWHGGAGGRIRVSVAPHSPYTVDPGYFKELEEKRVEMNEKHGGEDPVICCVHVAEIRDEVELIEKIYGVDVAEEGILGYLDGLGVLSKEFLAAHSVYVDDRGMDIMAERGVKVTHDPVSNFKLANDLCPVPEMISRGIVVSLGTDGPASNNSLDIFETMKFTSLVHKYKRSDPTLLPSNQVFRMATIQAARALNWDGLGWIAPGYLADLVLIDLNSPHLAPIYDEYSHLVYTVKASDVSTVIVDGEPVVEDKRLLTMDLEDLMERVRKTRDEILEMAMEVKGGEKP